MTAALRIPAVFMRGGTSKGVFILASDLRADEAARDRILLRTTGSPDPFCKHTDGMGGGTSSTSKVVIVSRSSRPGCDVDYLFGQVAIDAPVVDWSGNCGKLTAAVDPFAISAGLFAAPADGNAPARIWQANHRPGAHARWRSPRERHVPAGRRSLSSCQGKDGIHRSRRPGRRRRDLPDRT